MVAAGMAAVEVLYAAWVRPRLMRWGATDEEVAGPYPGAGLVPGGKRAATMAVTIDAPPDQVWPWLIQMDGDRGLWAFLLNELPDGHTRLVISGYQTLRPQWLERFANYWLYVPVVWPMQARMLAVLKRPGTNASGPLRTGRLAWTPGEAHLRPTISPVQDADLASAGGGSGRPS